MEIYDVIIVGAGPAGISTALHLIQQAPDLIPHTLILEKARFPRPKPCGGGILQDGVVLLRGLGLNFPDEVPHMVARFARFEFSGQGTLLQHQEESRAFYVIRREDFDTWLVQQARERGLTVLEGTRVLQTVPEEEDVKVVTEDKIFRARVVVGADGATGVVRQTVAGKHRRWAYAVMLRTPAEPKTCSYALEDAYFDFFCIPHGVSGYIWNFPLPSDGQPMRCWGVYDSRVASSQQSSLSLRWLSQELERHGYRLEDYPLQGKIIPWFQPSSTFSAPRILLVGDAAGVDYLYGEGISPAIGYGKIAAKAIVDAFQQGDFSFQKYSRQILGSELGKALRSRAAVANLLYRLRSPMVQRLIWQRMGRVMEWSVWNLLAEWATRERLRRARSGGETE